MSEKAAIAIRRGLVADAVELARFAARTFEETFAYSTAPSNMAAFLAETYGEAQQKAELEDPATRTLIAEAGGGIIAYAQVRWAEAPGCVTGEHAVELRRFYVDRPFHGRGLADQLMTAAEGVARALGGTRLWLGVFQHNERAIAFYTRRGFTRAGVQVFRLGEDEQADFIMVKELDQVSD